jgi:AsmA protein
MVIVKKLLKWLAVGLLPVVTLFAIAVIYVTFVVDINGYKSDIESLAREQGWDVSIRGDLVWQFFPKPGISIADISVSDQTSVSGSAKSLVLATNWTQLLSLGGGIEQLQLSSVRIVDGGLQWFPANSPRLQFNNIQLSTKNLSLQGNTFPISASASAFGGRKFVLDTDMAVQLDGRNMQRLSLDDLELRLDSIRLYGELSASDNGAFVQGNLKTNSFDLKQLMASLQPMVPLLTPPKTLVPTALTDLSLETSFTLDTEAASKFIGQLSVDGQIFDVDVTIDHSINSLTTLVSGDVLRAGDYLPAANSDGNNSGLFAPLAIPFALWQGSSQVEVNLGRIEFNDFSIENFYSNVFGNQRVLRLTSLNADVFDGQVNAIAKLDMRSSTPSFALQPSLSGIDMAQALPALADSAALTGLLNMDVNVQGSGNSLNGMLKSLTGAGQFELRSPSYADLNIEQTFCNAAALFGRSPQDRQDWPPGTQLEDLRGKFQLSQGNLEITEYSTATGNLNILGRGTIGLAKQNYSIKANARLDAETTSSNGCSVNKRLQNRQIPFVCKGTLDGSSANCKPDERVLKDLLKNTAFEKLGEQLLRNSDKEQDPLKNLFNDLLKRKLN